MGKSMTLVFIVEILLRMLCTVAYLSGVRGPVPAQNRISGLSIWNDLTFPHQLIWFYLLDTVDKKHFQPNSILPPFLSLHCNCLFQFQKTSTLPHSEDTSLPSLHSVPLAATLQQWLHASYITLLSGFQNTLVSSCFCFSGWFFSVSSSHCCLLPGSANSIRRLRAWT